jgi:putative SOS response-associated peptidase YedK
MFFAALYDTCVDSATGEVTHTYTVITTAASSQLAWVHSRMPAILLEDQIDAWLQAPSVPEAMKMLAPFDGKLEMYV